MHKHNGWINAQLRMCGSVFLFGTYLIYGKQPKQCEEEEDRKLQIKFWYIFM